MIYTGSCYCKEIKYEIDLASPDDARTSLCHCKNCKKFFGAPFGITVKIPKKALTITTGKPTVHVADNGSGVSIHREFCGTCGSGILEFGTNNWWGTVKKNAGDFTYIMYGSLDEPEELPPKGEFFCKSRDGWMPEIPGVFHKWEIKT